MSLKFKLDDRVLDPSTSELACMWWQRGDWCLHLSRRLLASENGPARYNVWLKRVGLADHFTRPMMIVDREVPALMLAMYAINVLNLVKSADVILRWQGLAREFDWEGASDKVLVLGWEVQHVYRKEPHEIGNYRGCINSDGSVGSTILAR